MSLLGVALAGRGMNDQAESMLVDGYEGLVSVKSKIPAQRQADLTVAFERIAPFYEAWGRPEAASAWRAKQATRPGFIEPKP